MTYQMPEHCKKVVADPARFSVDRIDTMLDRLYRNGPGMYDRPISSFEGLTGNDYEGYTEAWIKLLTNEKERRANDQS